MPGDHLFICEGIRVLPAPRLCLCLPGNTAACLVVYCISIRGVLGKKQLYISISIWAETETVLRSNSEVW